MANIRGEDLVEEQLPFEANQQNLLGPQDAGGFMTGTQAATTGSDAPSASSSPPSISSGQEETASQQRPFTPGIYDPSAGSVFEGFESGVGSLARGVQEGLGEAQGQFREQAGPSRSYGSSGAEGVLGRAIDPGATQSSRDNAEDAARAFRTASYGGPTGLDPGAVAGLQNDIRNIRAETQAMGRGSLVDLIEGNVPGLTPGQSAFEARHIRSQPGYSARARSIAQIPRALSQGIDQASGQAKSFATQRSLEESDISRLSTDYLRGQRAGILDPLREQAENLNQRDRELRQAYDLMKEQGSVDPLENVLDRVVTRDEEGVSDTGPWMEGDPAPGGEWQRWLESPIADMRRQSDAAKAAWRKKWAHTSDIPDIFPYVNYHGKASYGFTGPDGNVIDIKDKNRGLSQGTEYEYGITDSSGNFVDITDPASGLSPEQVQAIIKRESEARAIPQRYANLGYRPSNPTDGGHSPGYRPSNPTDGGHSPGARQGQTKSAIPVDPYAGLPKVITRKRSGDMEIALERTKELEKDFAGWAPWTGGKAGRYGRTNEGVHSYVDPLYFGDPLDPTNIASPEGFDDRWQFRSGTGASIQNLSSTKDRTKVNAINNLLDEVLRLGESAPQKSAVIAVNLERFFEQEDLRLKTQKKAVTATEKEYLEDLYKLRKAYKRYKSNSSWGNVMSSNLFRLSPPRSDRTSTGRGVLKEDAADLSSQTGKET